MLTGGAPPARRTLFWRYKYNDQQAVREAPAYDPDRLLSREDENRLHEHFRRAGYWQRGPEAWRRYPPAA